MVATDEGAALLRAVLDADREDDTVRLVFADWLQDNGQEDRAVFIRAQIGGSPRSVWAWLYWDHHKGPRWSANNGPKGHKGTAKLLNEMLPPAARWTRPTHYGATRVIVRRGFAQMVECPAADWLAHAASLLAAHPVERVRLTTEPNERDFGAIRLMNWSQRTAVYHRWPRVTFELPTEPQTFFAPAVGRVPPEGEPIYGVRSWRAGRPRTPALASPEGGAFLAGLDWRIEVRTEPDVTYGTPVRAADLYADTAAPIPRNLLGTSFGPVAATDRRGRLWRVERAVLAEADVDADVRQFRGRLRARATGPIA